MTEMILAIDQRITGTTVLLMDAELLDCSLVFGSVLKHS